MKQEKIDELMKKIDKKIRLPKYWDKFIEKNIEKFNFIIKDTKNKSCYCTKCHKIFYNTKVKMEEFYECPNCKNNLYVQSINKLYKTYKKSVNLVQRVNKQIIIRTFEILIYYNEDKKNMDYDIEEYARTIPGKGKFLSNSVYFYLGYMYIKHYGDKNVNWRSYDGLRFFSDYETYPFSEKKLVKGTNLEYAPISEFLAKNYTYNFLDALELAAYPSFELLWKMKLYNLSFRAQNLNKNGTFYKRFSVSKDYLEFMQKNNISYRELKMLRIIKKKDIDLLRECAEASYRDIKLLKENDILEVYFKYNCRVNSTDINSLREIGEFIDLKKLKEYQKGIKNLSIYKDYLIMSKKLALNFKSKKDLFPRNLISRHDKMQRKIKIEEDKEIQFKAYLRYLELSKYTYKNEDYIIFPCPSIDDIKEEGRQQGNCVGHLYLNPYINGKTEIFFIRKLKDITKSFITLEYKENEVVQKELPNHSRDFKNKQLDFIDKWCNYRAFIDEKEKYKKKIEKIKSIEYRLVA